jgi:hypothetical protein
MNAFGSTDTDEGRDGQEDSQGESREQIKGKYTCISRRGPRSITVTVSVIIVQYHDRGVFDTQRSVFRGLVFEDVMFGQSVS